MAGVYGFSSDDAKRIGHVVRQVEGDRSGRRLSGPEFGGPIPGVRMMLGKRSAASWGKESSAIVTAYSGSHPATATAGTVAAWNYFAVLPASSTSVDNWVALSNNGFGWVVIAAEC